MPIREIKLRSYKEQIFELFSEGAQPPSPHEVGAYAPVWRSGVDGGFTNVRVRTAVEAKKFYRFWHPY